MIPRSLIAPLILLAIGLLFGSTISWGCASCGSGGDDPLVLYPNEKLKGYLSLAQSSHFTGINPDGSHATAGGPTSKWNLNSSFGYGFSPQSFATVFLPIIQNIRGTKQHTAIGDISVAGRYTIQLQSIDEPEKPQMQILYGYKHPSGRSIYETNEPTTGLDVTGSGFAEVKLGVDIWFGITRLKPGFNQQFSQPLARSFAGSTYAPGAVARTTLSLGYEWFDSWTTTGGINREERAKIKVDGMLQQDSDKLNYSAFLLSDYKMPPAAVLRVSLSRQAALFDNYNTSRFDVMSVAYLYTFE